ncbi:DUF711 family protein [Lyngbya aestuarii]|uniref:DUF711 family protein n=1 Tax=Lyngbya aestuarii TaxID=118322 RepID=UPI00403E1433
MKIRAITMGISLQSPQVQEKIRQAADFNHQIKSFLAQQGYEVQTTRIATNPWCEYLPGLSPPEIVSEVQKIEQICQSLDVSFFNIGYADSPEQIAIIPEINSNTSIIYCSSKIGSLATGIDLPNTRESAQVIKRISQQTEGGAGNFRFCAWANCPAGIPFFPASYHEGNASFALGLECSDLVMQAFSQSSNLTEAENNLKSIFVEEVSKLDELCQRVAEKFAIEYRGIDSSLAPSLDKTESIAFAYESLGLGKFGQPGTLAISAIITRVLQSLPVKLCGYSGLMLPVCEDVGLAQRANEQTYNLTDLLLYSAVCGCGLDTVPIPGKITVEKIEAILLDMASLALKLDKPLSARLFPIPGKQAGEITEFNSPYLVDCRIFNVE